MHALCFNSPTLSLQSVSMWAFWLRPPTPLQSVSSVRILTQTPNPPQTRWCNTWTLPYVEENYNPLRTNSTTLSQSHISTPSFSSVKQRLLACREKSKHVCLFILHCCFSPQKTFDEKRISPLCGIFFLILDCCAGYCARVGRDQFFGTRPRN